MLSSKAASLNSLNSMLMLLAAYAIEEQTRHHREYALKHCSLSDNFVSNTSYGAII